MCKMNWERLLAGLFILGFYILASYVVYQTKEIVIHSCHTGLTHLIKITGFSAFLAIPIYMGGTFLSADLLFSLPFLIIFGCFPHNH